MTSRVDRAAKRPRLFGGLAAAALVIASVVGASLACITAYAPNIRREAHHAAMSPQSPRGACLVCHELESSMARRMAGMDPATLATHMEEMMGGDVIRPPLVADWMAKERRGCVDCHAIRGRP